MVKVIQLADDGTETASIEVDDFTLEVIYSGLAEMLRDAANEPTHAAAPVTELSRQAQQRRDKILNRLRG
jgi:hypothetical protein